MQSTCLQPHFESVFFSFHTWLSWSRVRELIWKLAWLVLWPFPQKIFSASSYQNFRNSSYNLCRNFKINNKSYTQIFKNGQPMNNACNANYSYKLVRVHIHMYRALRVQNQGLSDYHREKKTKAFGYWCQNNNFKWQTCNYRFLPPYFHYCCCYLLFTFTIIAYLDSGFKW